MLLSRNTVVIGAVLVTLISFGLGYFFGFKGTDGTESEKPAKETAKQEEPAVPAGEKKVLDDAPAAKDAKEKETASAAPAAPANPASPVNTPVSAPIVPSAPAKADSIKPSDPIPEIASPKPKGQSPQAPAPGKSRAKNAAGTRKASGNQERAAKEQAKDPDKDLDAPAPDAAVKEAPQVKKPAKKQFAAGHRAKSRGKKAVAAARVRKVASEAVKKDVVRKTESSKKLYTIQMGAFPTKEGAEQLMQSLKAKGYKPYIVDAGGGDTYYRVRVGSFHAKKDADRDAASMSKETGMQNFVTTK
ncbi:MAG TPA: SPOR domain-containing protein [Dissulfurispiraceae bacterium]